MTNAVRPVAAARYHVTTPTGPHSSSKIASKAANAEINAPGGNPGVHSGSLGRRPGQLRGRNDMAVTTGSEGEDPRLRLQPDHSGPAPLDGGWWPRCGDPAAELPGLILALDAWHGRITRVMLGVADWDASRPRRVKVSGPAGSRVVRLGWFATMPAGLLTAMSANGQRTDLVTVPPPTRDQDAAVAMGQAAQAGNRDDAPAILAAISAAAGRTAGTAAGKARPAVTN
jgi:hypothetical protein